MRNNVAFLATDVGRLFRKRFDVVTRQLGVTGPQWRMLAAIRRSPGMNQGAVANWLEVEAITAGRMIDRLVKADLVERRDDPCDRRSWRLYLTDKADRQMGDLGGFADQVFEEAFAGFTQAERATLLALLERVRANLSEAIPDEALESMAHG
jgi:DNA-binding MarR family transcriptional regulator